MDVIKPVRNQKQGGRNRMKGIRIAAFVLLGAAMLLPRSAAAESTLYGNLQYSMNYVNETHTGFGGLRGVSGQDNTSLFGWKGEYGDEIKAFFHLQTGANADANTSAFSQRFFMGGIKGWFGKLAYGRMTNAYKQPGFDMDPFYNLSHIGASGLFSATGAAYGLSSLTNGFTDNALQYVSPRVAGADVTAGFYADDSNENGHGLLGGVSYVFQDLKAGLVYAVNHKKTATLPGFSANDEALRLYAAYKLRDMKFGLSLENYDPSAAGKDTNFVYLTGTFPCKHLNTEFIASLGLVDNGNFKGHGAHVGAFYKLTENTRPYLLMGLVNLDDIDPAAVKTTANPHLIALGMQHKFSISAP